MKILLLADTLDVGGAETHIYELSRSLLLSGHSVMLFSGGGCTARALSQLGAFVVDYPCLSRFPKKGQIALSSFLEVLRDFKPTLVHAHTRKTLLLCQAAIRIIPFPLVFTAHAFFSPHGLKGLLTRPPRFTLAVSEDIRRHFIDRFGADRENIFLTHNGIDTDRFSPKLKPAGAHLLTISRLDSDCSLCAQLLCAIAPRLALLYSDFRLTIVGGGSDLESIKKLAEAANREIGRQAVYCVGAQNDVLPYILDCDVFAGVSRAALEAMSCNKPTVLCGNEGYFGICDKDNFKIAANENFCARSCGQPNRKQLYEDIVKIISSPHSPSLHLRECVVEGYSAKAMTDGVIKVYETAVSSFRVRQRQDAVLCGYYGFGNLGDELVRQAICSSLPSLRITTVGARGNGRIWRFDLVSLCRAIKNSNGLILGGGSLLQNSTSRRSLYYYLFIIKIADFYGKRVMLYANGIGPLNGERAIKACQKALHRVDAASLRDSQSLNAAHRLLPTSALRCLTCDPALSRITAKNRKNRIAVFIRGEDESIDLCRALSKALSHLSAKWNSPSVVFAPMNPSHDLSLAKRLADAMPFSASVYRIKDTDGLINFVAESRLVISSRLHALITAASAGVPFIALCGDPKLKAFARQCQLSPLLAIPLECRLDEHLNLAAEYIDANETTLSQALTAKCTELSALSKSDAKTALRLFGTEE